MSYEKRYALRATRTPFFFSEIEKEIWYKITYELSDNTRATKEEYADLLTYDHDVLTKVAIDIICNFGRNMDKLTWYDSVIVIAYLAYEESSSSIFIQCAPAFLTVLGFLLALDDHSEYDGSEIIYGFDVIGIEKYPEIIPSLIGFIAQSNYKPYRDLLKDYLFKFPEQALTLYRSMIQQLPD